MEKVIPMSWLNQILLGFSIAAAILSLIVQGWTDLAPLPIYISVSWAVFITIISVWLSCCLLRLMLKANSPIPLRFINKWMYKRLVSRLSSKFFVNKDDSIEIVYKSHSENQKNLNSAQKGSIKCNNDATFDICKKESPLTRKKKLNVTEMTREINAKCVEIWYKNISNDRTFPDEAQDLLSKFLTRLVWKASLVDKIKVINKLANVLLLHLKEYRRALRRVEKGAAASIEEAYKYLHPGSRSASTLEHMLYRLVTVLAQEFLQWELTSSLPCKLLLSILAKRLLIIVNTISCPDRLIENLLILLEAPSNKVDSVTAPVKQNINGTISVALNDGIISVTAAVIPQQLPKSVPKSSPIATNTSEDKNAVLIVTPERPTLCLEGLSTEHRGLWGGSITDTDLELDEDKISPVYEEPTDFATTIARLRNLLQQKSTASTPLHVEEKSYVIYEGSQFMNLSIPWTEFHTATDGSQQLYYCIQFDDIEQRGVDLFETTTATVKRQYADFVQLHLSLDEISSLTSIMSELVLPEGGRIELEMYLKTLCTRLANECPPQLRHFLRPSSSAGKKADVVAPRLDRFLAKTVTGVFNTLKTVVPGFELDQEEEASPLPTLMPLSDIPWRFVEDIKSKSLTCELQQLIAERTEYCTVDTAYEAVDSMEASGDSELLDCWWETINTSYDDEVDELDSNLTLTCTVIDLVCELLAGIASNNTLQQEAVVRWTKLLFGNISEPILQKIILWLFDSLSGSSLIWDASHNDTSQNDTQLKDKLLHILEEKISYDIKLIFGEDDIHKALNYLLSSYKIKKINVDLNMQMLDALVSELLISCKTNRDATTN
ncbi:uncharacterized protein [Mycetomoellerius zeteki]|uniref:uncharacterized protein n=1 Tax=Mycetomoellerius zeteki TaxID=64791 RepID=UPI00084EC66F|nr:PREDICTED: uncharacterized protein LOC108730464 [Trachymyrmex zeteki]